MVNYISSHNIWMMLFGNRGVELDNNLKDIYDNNKEIINKINKIIFYFQSQNYDKALRLAMGIIDQFGLFINQLKTFVEKFPDNDISFDKLIFLQSLQELLEVQENRDYVLLADLYKVNILPMLIQLQESIISTEKITINDELYKNNLNILSHSNHELSLLVSQMT